MSTNRNISYVTAPSHSPSATPVQATRAASEGGAGAAAEYSRIGPSYETNNSRRQQQVAGKNQVSARQSERYEFSEAHLATVRGGGVQGEGTMDYEVPQQSGRYEEYSHLQH